MMALVDDHVPVARDKVVHLAVTYRALDHRHVKLAVRLPLASAEPVIRCHAELPSRHFEPHVLERWLAALNEEHAAGAAAP